MCKKPTNSNKGVFESEKVKRDYSKIEFLIGNTFVVFCGRVFQQRIGIHMGTNCSSRRPPRYY